MPDSKYLHLSRNLTIFFKDGQARYLSNTSLDSEDAEQAVLLWQEAHPDHPDFQLAERWLAEFKPATRSEGLAEELGVSEYQARQMLPHF